MTSIAVIDIGTQSTNVLVCDAQGKNLYRAVTATRLGDTLHETGLISHDAMQRTTDQIVRHIEKVQQLGATRIILTGTAACRRAGNTTDFLEQVFRATGLHVEVLTEKQEAQLSFTGALSGLPRTEQSTVVIDIGGGSTEYIVGFESPEMSASIPFGAVTATSSHISGDPAPPEDLTNLLGAVADELEEVCRDIPALLTPGRVVGVAGTIVTMAAVEIGLAEFDDDVLNGFVLTKDAAEDVFRTLATENRNQRILNPGLPEDRGDIIVAGCCILVATMRRLHIDEIIVSTRNLLDGVMDRERALS
jgi:exopolyphosphatase/guanosine-5'-triphosphate,3'-diphosphate pyrophosphatase